MQRLQLEDESLLSPIKAPMVHLSQIIFPFDSDVACSHCMQMKGLALGPMIKDNRIGQENLTLKFSFNYV